MIDPVVTHATAIAFGMMIGWLITKIEEHNNPHHRRP